MFRFRTAVAGFGAVAAAAAVTALGATPAHAADSQVYVVHGIPGATVDVYVNGQRALDDFTPTTVAGPLTLPEGSYDLKVVAGDAADGNAPAIVAANDVAVPGGANISVVAHLNAAGQPALTPFVNDVSKVAAGKARLVVRHTAAAPAVDVRANGEVAFPGLTNPKEAKADLAAGTVSADVVLAGTDTVAIPATEVTLKEGTATIVYAIGSAEANSLAVVPQVLSGLHSAPGGVPAGSGGGADESVPLVLLVLGALGVAVAAGSAARLATGTRR